MGVRFNERFRSAARVTTLILEVPNVEVYDFAILASWQGLLSALQEQVECNYVKGKVGCRVDIHGRSIFL